MAQLRKNRKTGAVAAGIRNGEPARSDDHRVAIDRRIIRALHTPPSGVEWDDVGDASVHHGACTAASSEGKKTIAHVTRPIGHWKQFRRFGFFDETDTQLILEEFALLHERP